jgi:hypothetical protein
MFRSRFLKQLNFFKLFKTYYQSISIKERINVSHQVKQFHYTILQDAVLKERLRAATDRASLVELTVQLGAELGYNFTRQEVEVYINKNRLLLMMQFS